MALSWIGRKHWLWELDFSCRPVNLTARGLASSSNLAILVWVSILISDDPVGWGGGGERTAVNLSLDSVVNTVRHDELPAWDNGIRAPGDTRRVDCAGGGGDVIAIASSGAKRRQKISHDCMLTINANAWGTFVTLLRQSLDCRVGFIGVQETRLELGRQDSARTQASALGWDAHFSPAAGCGKPTSGGVALLARQGISVKALTSQEVGFHLPWSHRCGFWLAQGTFPCGFVVVVLC